MLTSALFSIIISTNSLTLDFQSQQAEEQDLVGRISISEGSKSQILGIQSHYGIREDLVEVAKELSEGYKDRLRQILVHSRAHDLFMIAQSGEDAYNAYLLMTAAQRCLSTKDGVGVSGSSSALMKMAKKQINSDKRRQAVVKSDYMLRKGGYPPLNMTEDYTEYCTYTNQPIMLSTVTSRIMEAEKETKTEAKESNSKKNEDAKS